MKTISPYITVRELAGFLRMSEDAIRSAHQDGRLPFEGIRLSNKGRSQILFERAAVVEHFKAIGRQADADRELYLGLVNLGGLSPEAAERVVVGLRDGSISHDEVKGAIAARVAS